MDDLEWDSSHFGICVARLTPTDLSEEDLASALDRARRRGVQLIYWRAPCRRTIGDALLMEFGGKRVVGYVMYSKEITGPSDPSLPSSELSYSIREAGRDPAEADRLRDLAILSGEWSRFRLDPCIPKTAFEAMYALWILGSVRGDLADLVLVADDEQGMPVGLLTFATSSATSTIGLVATDPRCRGRGIASGLSARAHRRMWDGGTRHCSVVTQTENRPACDLYERLGYRRAEEGCHFHFWLDASHSGSRG